MLIDDANEVFEILRGGLPYYVILFLPILIIISPLNPVDGAHDFTVYRMQQYDLQGNTRGCRSSIMNMEARTLDSGSYVRRCVVARLLDLTPFKFREIMSQGAGGLLVLLPANLSSLSRDERQHVLELESAFLAEEVTVPVYFTNETPEVLNIYSNAKSANSEDQKTSAAEAIIGALTSTGFQMVASAVQSKPLPDIPVASIYGKLPGYGIEDQLPTIALVAHYDSFGVAPSLSFGADSNGSGVAALLELARIFSRLYSNSKTQARFNLLFLLSGGGKFSYQGTKKWIEDSLDSSEGNLLQDSIYTLCLETLGSGNQLFLHVSKPPKEGSYGAVLLQELKSMTRQFYPDVKFEMIHKKINLAEDTLAWEHERFSVRRLPAFTISGLASAREPLRNSILDTRDRVDIDVLQRNVKIIAESLARHIYNVTQSDIEVCSQGLSVQSDHLSAWLDRLTTASRAAQLVAGGVGKDLMITDLEQAFLRYLKDVRVLITKPDKRDPEFTFYDVASTTITAYSVKPAIFDLVLMIAVSLYLCVLYCIIQFFPKFYLMMTHMGIPTAKVKQT